MDSSSQSRNLVGEREFGQRLDDVPREPKSQSNLRKVWEMNTPFRFAPEKPDGDHWRLLLEPLLKKDKARCDAWKDEVQNLLIFAGLFSAVVTSFIIESYKGLQRDPDSDVVNLLSQIVTRLGSPTNNPSDVLTQTSSLLPTFSPSPSSIRTNIFWFISLVLSLTTVLVGIVSLQWLREHQNYTDMTPRQQYAVFNMRDESLEKWRVGCIFAAMPLLLQSALVLFFTGMIDFLLAFGHIAVVIPVTAVIGLTLLFLIATTLFPTLQGLSLFFDVQYSGRANRPPVQCPYKSPQSDAIRAMSQPVFVLLRRIHPCMRSVWQKMWQWPKILSWNENTPPLSQDTFATSRYLACSGKTWPAFDLNWLVIRDGYMRRAFYRPLKWYQISQDVGIDTLLPIWDTLQGLTSKAHPNISPLYHAFLEICELSLPQIHQDIPDDLDYPQNAYLHDILARKSDFPTRDVCFSDFYDDICSSFGPHSAAILKHQNLFAFLSTISSAHENMSLHKAELQVRLVRFLYKARRPVLDERQQGSLPRCLVLHKFTYSPSNESLSYEEYSNFVWQVAQTIMVLFEEISNDPSPHALINMPCARRDALRGYMVSLGRRLSLAQHRLALFKEDPAIMQIFDAIFVFVNHALLKEMTSLTSSSAGGSPSLLFYTAALYVEECRWLIPHFPQSTSSFNLLLDTISIYKNLTIDIEMIDDVVEKQLATPIVQGSAYHEMPFSSSWWSHFEGLRIEFHDHTAT